MGRHYSGDINGKFLFARQASNAADCFGVLGYQPDVLYYYFSTTDLPAVIEELDNIYMKYGNHILKLQKLLAQPSTSYTDAELALALNVPEDDIDDILSAYADYVLGCKIRDCIQTTGQCEFEAEL